MFEKLRRKKFKKQIDKALLNRDVSGRNGKVKTLAFLYSGDLITNVSEMKKIADALHISEEHISFLSFVTFDKKNTSLTREQFTNKDFSWRGEIKSKEVIDFVNMPFDILICFLNGTHQHLDVIAAKSKAKFKIGFSKNDERIHDLIVSVDVKNTDEAGDEIKKYLTIMGKLNKN